MPTIENLKTAFAGESQASRKYLAFAKQADEEGNVTVAKLFRASAKGETIHAFNHLAVMKAVKNSRANIETAIDGETQEIESLYPEFIKQAEIENNGAAKLTFSRALAVEKIHQELFQKAMEKIKNGEDPEDGEYFVCQICGYPVLDNVPDNCPICGAQREKFKIVRD